MTLCPSASSLANRAVVVRQHERGLDDVSERRHLLLAEEVLEQREDPLARGRVGRERPVATAPLGGVGPHPNPFSETSRPTPNPFREMWGSRLATAPLGGYWAASGPAPIPFSEVTESYTLLILNMVWIGTRAIGPGRAGAAPGKRSCTDRATVPSPTSQRDA